jgi:hypothetical protein
LSDSPYSENPRAGKAHSGCNGHDCCYLIEGRGRRAVTIASHSAGTLRQALCDSRTFAIGIREHAALGSAGPKLGNASASATDEILPVRFSATGGSSSHETDLGNCTRCVLCFLFGVFVVRSLWAGQEALTENPPPAAPQEVTTPLEQTFERAPPLQPNAISEAVDTALDHLSPFVRDTRLIVRPRTYYFDQHLPDGKASEAWAGGGSLAYTSGWLAERIRVGGIQVRHSRYLRGYRGVLHTTKSKYPLHGDQLDPQVWGGLRIESSPRNTQTNSR